ncbi:hypothetical protein HGB48_18910 [Actinomadura latina]|uniref:Tetratricopeptide repeat protein n=1 Tax=Actinomadura latina TaxID=163603 RepID=A0A846YXV6_9ACTN|nr:hypothetical protein [Actinomadura latina]
MRATLAAEPVIGFLPLAAHHRRPAAQAPAPEPAPRDDLASLDDLDDLDELLDTADRCRRKKDLPGMLAAWRRFDAVAATTEPTPLQHARRLDARGVEHAVDRAGREAVECWEEAARLFGELGDETRRHRTLGRLGALRVDLGDAGGLDQVIASAEHCTAHPVEADDAPAALLRLAAAYLRLDRPADALTALDRAAAGDAPDRAGELWYLRGQALLMSGETDDGIAALRRSAELSRASGDPEEIAAPALQLARAVARRQNAPDEETLALLDEALAAMPGPSPLRAAALAERGASLIALDRPADGVPDLVEAIAEWTAEGMHENAVHLRVDLAGGYLSTDRPLEAAEAAEEVLQALPEPGGDADPSVHHARQRARLVLAHAQKQLREEGAAATFASLADDAARDGEHGAEAHFRYEAADVLTELDMDGPAAERYAESAEAYEKAGDPYGVVRARRRAAVCLMWSGDVDAAVPAMETARAALAGLPPDNEPARVWETALTSFEQARVLARAGRVDDAAAHASAAVDGFTALDQTGPAEEATRLLEDIRAALG